MDKNKKLFDGWEVFATKHFEIHWHFIVYTEFQYGHSNSNCTIRNQIFFYDIDYSFTRHKMHKIT